MATRTSVGSGLWSAAGTWDTGVPVDGDAVVIAAGHTVTFDVDQSGFANGLSSLTITGILQASTSAGSYYLKMKSNFGGAGTLRAGTSTAVPYPANCTFIIHINGNYQINMSGPESFQLFCQEPTYRRIYLSENESAGETVLGVDTDVSSDIWKAGDLIIVSDISGSLGDSELRTIAAGGIAAGSIKITSGLTRDKSAGSNVFLVSRNVKVIGNDYTNGFAASGNCGGNYYAEIRQLAYASTASSNLNIIFGGSVVVGYGFNGTGSTIKSVVLANTGSTVFFNYIYSFNNVYDGAIVSGWTAGALGNMNHFKDVEFVGNTQTFIANNGAAGRNVFSGCNFHHNYVDISSCVFVAHNTIFGSTTEYQLYNSVAKTGRDYSESYNHDQVSGAFRAWTRGGITSSTATSPPTGRTRSYQTVCESATYPGWYQREIVVDAGRQLRIRFWLKADAGVEIKAQLVLPTADPLITGTGTGEWQQIGTSDGTWYEYVTSWTNSATYPVTIYARVLSTAASGNGYSDMMWAFDRTPLVR